MRRFFISVLVAGALAVPAIAALKPGASAPDFNALASRAGKIELFSLAAALKKGPVVIYFYSAAFTAACDLEAHAFAENADKFAAAKTTIVGISGDNIDRLNEFSADPQYCAGKFPMASDLDGDIGRSFGLKVQALNVGGVLFKDMRGHLIDNKYSSERKTFVITPDHKIIAVLPSTDDKLRMQDHAEKSLAVVQALAAKKPS